MFFGKLSLVCKIKIKLAFQHAAILANVIRLGSGLVSRVSDGNVRPLRA